MNRLFYILPLLLVIFSCSKDTKKAANEKYLFGDWVRVAPMNEGGEISSKFYDLDAMGFSFYSNHTYDNKAGFFKEIKDDKWGKEFYLGSNSKFKVSDDSLYLSRPDNNKWHAYRIVKLTADSLKFGDDEVTRAFKRIQVPKVKAPPFDEIILSTSDCFGPCPISSTIINSNGKVVFEGQQFTNYQGLFISNISTERYKQLQDNFTKIDFDSLKNDYTSRITDNQTICTTFIKGGKIYKSVSDYAQTAPLIFRWAYVPVENLYQQIPLKNISSPQYIPDFNFTMNATFIKGNMALRLKQSETFLLMDYLRNGKICKNKFSLRFKMHRSFEIHKLPDVDTDGRYYTFFVKGKPITIDIGFDFYDVNAKNWVWRKADEFD